MGEKVGLIDKAQTRAIENLAKDYDHDNPFAAVGIDLAVAGATMLIPGADVITGGRALAGVAKLAGRAAPAIERGTAALADTAIVRGAGFGAVQGGLQGAADAGEGNRMSGAAKGATQGAVAGSLVGGAGRLVGKTLAPVANAIAPRQAAFTEINAALRKEGKTLKQLNDFLAANPGSRVADFSPGVARVVGAAGRTTGGAADSLNAALREDATGQAGRVTSGVAKGLEGNDSSKLHLPAALPPSRQPYPLQQARDEVVRRLDDLAAKKDAAYSTARQELTTITPELKDALDHPEVKGLVEKAYKDYANLRRADPTSDVAKAPKFRAGKEMPSAVLEDLQRAVGKAAYEEGTGSTRYGALKAAQEALKKGQTGTMPTAQQLAARLGSEDTQTGLRGAQAWGAAFSKGLKGADIDVFRKMNPEQKQHAAIGMLTGLEAYLHQAGRLPEGALDKVVSALRSPEIEEVLGKKTVNQVKQVYAKEAARQRANTLMAGAGGAKDRDIEQAAGHVTSHVVAHATGLGRAGMLAFRFLTSEGGMTEAQARNVIDMAGKPGGMKTLKEMGYTRKVMDKLYAMRGAPTTRAALNNQQAHSTLRDDDR
ncbi:hypothetical protein [Paraburkholderia xenovorans]